MGTFSCQIEIGDPEARRFETVDALADTGASFTLMPTSLLQRLGVEPHTKETFVLADGRQVEKDVGRTWVRVGGRTEITLVIFGDEGTRPLLGVYALEGLALGVDPTNQRLIPTPRLLLSVSLADGRIANGGPTMRGVARLTGPGA